jgi:hypothetical protein
MFEVIRITFQPFVLIIIIIPAVAEALLLLLALNALGIIVGYRGGGYGRF